MPCVNIIQDAKHIHDKLCFPGLFLRMIGQYLYNTFNEILFCCNSSNTAVTENLHISTLIVNIDVDIL